ncbi:hypothetical protein EUTSA_v10017056mg [Eutrema salsugineum]|uniref:NAC domain-containing protein n=1 Tax=Eutrema salsugineum TaxID=72664 RepID=V4MC61_EUTSA|nr:NAC domain-containing protein 6 [Eutrema salsugineum]ESQ52767.1 hypothetical protein EUTSA_v10017056mg [Eutrema salsugineum]
MEETQNDRGVGFRFRPTDLGLVRLHLRNMVVHGKSGCITTLDVYKDEPWLLDHVNNDLFYENQWYYFVPRPNLGGKKPKRTVPGRGESEGGTWRSVTSKKEIDDDNKKVEGYMQGFVYTKQVNGIPVGTNWLMTEYSLHNDVHDDLVLCWIRYNTDKKPKPEVGDQAPRLRNNVLPNQVREKEEEEEEEDDLTGFANGIEDMLLEGEHGDVTHEQQQQQDPPILLQGHDSGFETQSNDQNQWDDFGFDGSENLMIDVGELMAVEGDVTYQQKQHEAQF